MNKSSDQGNVRLMHTDDLDKVLSWRNHLNVRQFMYTQHEISAHEHHAWFAQASKDKKRDLLIFEINGTALGFVQLKLHDNLHMADWGFYLAPEAAKGTGKKLGAAALTYAFTTKCLHKICGEAIGFNERSIKFHLGLGFQQEGLLRDQHYDGANYHNIICFGLLANEWPANAAEVNDE